MRWSIEARERRAMRVSMCANSQIGAKKEEENHSCWLRIDKLSCTLRT
ncbi:hypothetical protein ACN9MU_27960 [Pseudoduganella sp. R-32]